MLPAHVYTAMRSLLPMAVAGLLVAPTARAACTDRPVTLKEMRGCSRALLVFAPNPNDAQLLEQFRQLEPDAAGFRDRGLLLVPVLAPGGQARLPDSELPTATLTPEDEERSRKRFHYRDGFEAVLIGKDGSEKLRTQHPLTIDTLHGTIDAMPMRKQEMTPR